MSLDVKAIRMDIAAVLTATGVFNVVDPYERRDRSLSDMPIVQLWRDPISGPGPGEAQAEFGSYAYSITWRIRIYLPLSDDDAAAQDLSDSISVAVREAFDTQPALISNTVQSAELVSIVSDAIIRENTTPFMFVEGTLITQAEARPG